MKLDKHTVAKRYGKAIFELAVESEQTENVHQELNNVKAVFQEVPVLQTLLSDRRLDSHEKEALMQILLQGFTGIVHNTLAMIYDYNRMAHLLLIIDEFERRYYQSKKIAQAVVTTTIPLTEEQKNRLSVNIGKKLGFKELEITEQIDPDILGGVIVEANHHVIDGSIRNRLEQLHKQLTRGESGGH